MAELASVGCIARGPRPEGTTSTKTPRSRSIPEICRENKIAYPPKRLFIRAFKQERELEVWGGNRQGRLTLLQVYPIAAASGEPGPKRREGDLQVPEGFYHVARFNPRSRFHLSLGLDYPNASDRILGGRARLGGDIFIHGNHVSAGCLAMTDPKIEEIYFLASHAAKPVPVHIFPCRMVGAGYQRIQRDHPELVAFWGSLEPIYRAFEERHVVPRVSVGRDGRYR